MLRETVFVNGNKNIKQEKLLEGSRVLTARWVAALLFGLLLADCLL